MHYQRSPRLWKMLAASTFAFVLSFSTLTAQTWEFLYGEPGVPTRDGGRRGVIPVQDNCGLPNGYISVGYSDVAGNSDVYVVRTNCRGQRVWEYTYDITGNNDQDYGRSIAPIRNAAGLITDYVIGGWTSANGQDAFILQIDCNGNVIWSNTYGGPNTSEGAHDILVTRSGDPTCGTFPGDIVLGGWANTPTGSDGYLVRTNAGGGLIWDATYNNTGGGMFPPSMEIFMAITEATPLPPAVAGGVPPAGDIVGIGISHDMMPPVPPNPPASPDGWVVRVNGCNGAIGAAPQGAGNYGSVPAPDGFFSGIELQNPASTGFTGAFDFAGNPIFRPNIALIGEYNGAGSEIYLVELAGGNPTTPVVETVLGIAGQTDMGRDIKEITQPIPAVPTALAQWDLLITGHNDDPGTAAPGDLFVYALAPGFVPLFGSLFSANSLNGSETGWSLFPEDGATCRFGVIASGTSTSDPLGVGDPEDMYLVKTNGFLKTNCAAPYNPTAINVTTVYTTFPTVGTINWFVGQATVRTKRAMGLQVCAYGQKESPTTGDELTFETMVDASAAPNPITVGEMLQLQVTNAVDGRVSLTLSNSIGETVKTLDNVQLDGAGVVTMSTEDVPAGVYNATVRSGSENVTVRVVVVE